MKATRTPDQWPDHKGDYRIQVDDKVFGVWLCGPTFGDQAEQVAERVLAAINGEALEALPQTERVLVTKLRGRRLPDGREIVRAWQGYGDDEWHAELVASNGAWSIFIHPDGVGMVEVLTEDAS